MNELVIKNMLMEYKVDEAIKIYIRDFNKTDKKAVCLNYFVEFFNDNYVNLSNNVTTYKYQLSNLAVVFTDELECVAEYNKVCFLIKAALSQSYH